MSRHSVTLDLRAHLREIAQAHGWGLSLLSHPKIDLFTRSDRVHPDLIVQVYYDIAGRIRRARRSDEYGHDLGTAAGQNADTVKDWLTQPT